MAKKVIFKIYKWATATRLRKFLSSVLIILILFTSIRYLFLKPKEVLAADVYLGLDEGYGTSGAVHDTNNTISAGSITNAVWKTEDLCQSGKCIYFDGTGDYVSFADNANLDMGSGQAVTIEGWFRTPDITSGTRTLISKYDSGDSDGGYKITMNSSGQIVFGIDGGNSFPSDSVTSTSAYDDNQWHHFAAVKNGSSSITLYIDALSVGTPDNSPAADASNDDAFYIGIDNGSSNGWSGFIDEVKVIRSVRSADQVKADYNGGTPSDGSSAGFSSDQNFTSDGLVGYWKLDESSGNPSDHSGNGNTLTNNSTTTFVAGKFANGSEHIPASTQYFSAGSSSVNTYYFDGSDATASDPNGLWDNDPNAFDGSTSTSADVPGRICEGSTTTKYLGAEGTNAPASGGTISQVRARIYGNSLYFPSGTGLMASIATDGWSESLGLLSNSNSAAGWGFYTTLSSPTGGWTWAKVQALETRIYGDDYGGDPACDYLYAYRVEVEVTTSGSASIPVNTVSFWTNPDSDTNYYVSLSSGAYITSSGGTLSANGFTNPKYYVNGAETQTVTANTWQLVTVTSDTSITADQLYIGRQGTNYYDGTLDEVRLYNRKFSPAEIQKLYQWAPGPVGYWKMDENQGGFANDSSGNDHIGTLTNNPKWTKGKIGGAINIPTNTSYVSVDDNADFDIDYQMTIEAWVRGTADTSTNRSIADKGVSNTSEFWFGTSGSTGRIGLMLNPGDADHTDRYYTYGNTNILDSKWHHVAGTYDGSFVRVYLDGKLDVTPAAHSDNIYDGVGTFNIGRTISFGTTYSWVGDIDDVRIYKYARTPEQINEDMNAGNPLSNSSVGSAIANWNFDEGALNTCSGGSADFCDSSQNALDLTYSTTTGGYTNSGKVGKAFSPGGSTWATMSDNSKLDFNQTEDMAISFWMNSTISSGGNPTATEYIVNKPPSSTTNGGYAIYTNTSGQVCFGIDDDNSTFPEDSVCTSSDVYDNLWHQITAVKTGTSRLDMYVDTKANGTPDVSLSSTVNTMENSSTFYVGSSNASNDTDDYNGYLDKLQIFRFAPTTDQINSIYNQGTNTVIGSTSSDSSGNSSWGSSDEYCPPGQGTTCVPPVAHWKFDENTGTSAYDTSGNNLTGTLGDGTTEYRPAWAKAKTGGGLRFDGNDDIVTLNDNDVFSSGFITVESWVKYHQLSTTKGELQYIIRNSHSGLPWLSFALYLDNTNPNKFVGSVVNQAGGTPQNIVGGTTAAIETWYHVALTWDGNYINLYVNGVKDATPVSYSGTGIFNSDSTVRIGAQYSGGSRTDGIIDDVRFYNYARTAAQVAWDYNKGGPVGWWQMDETSWNGTAGEVKDNSGNAFNGVRGGSATTTTGKINNGGSFNGSSDYVDLGIPSALQLSSTGSIAAWINWTTGDNNPAIVCNSNWSTDVNGYCLAGYGGTFHGEIGAAASNNRIYGTRTFQNDGLWHHVAFTWSGTQLNLYVDGVPDATPVTQTITPVTNVYNLTVGKNPAAANHYFTGKIDDVRVYNYALTAQQVKTVMNNNSALRFTPITGSP